MKNRSHEMKLEKILENFLIPQKDRTMKGSSTALLTSHAYIDPLMFPYKIEENE